MQYKTGVKMILRDLVVETANTLDNFVLLIDNITIG